MNDIRFLQDAFNKYYEDANNFLKQNNAEEAQRNFRLATETCYKMAKKSESANLKKKYVDRGDRLVELASKIKVRKTVTSDEETYSKITSDVVVQEDAPVSLAEAMEMLNKLVGLDDVKRQVSDWVDQIKVFRMRKENNLPVPP